MLNGKKYIQSSEKFQNSGFQGKSNMARTSRMIKNIFTAVKIFRANSIFQA